MCGPATILASLLTSRFPNAGDRSCLFLCENEQALTAHVAPVAVCFLRWDTFEEMMLPFGKEEQCRSFSATRKGAAGLLLRALRTRLLASRGR